MSTLPANLQPLELRQCAVHTITTKPWPIETAIDRYARAGFGGISIWRDTMEGRSPETIRRQLRDAELTAVSLVRGGFIAHRDKEAQKEALEDNRRCIAEAEALGIPLIVLVCGADPAWSLEESRTRITEALVTLAPEAAAAGVRLGIEPLHPMYADTRSAVNTLAQANEIARQANAAVSRSGGAASSPATTSSATSTGPTATPSSSTPGGPTVCSVVDVYHLWWDPALQQEIHAAGRDNLLAAFHVCDWRVPTEHMLLDRGLMGEGCINVPQIRSWVEQAGFRGPRHFTEVEIFSERYWAMDQDEWLAMVAQACVTST